MLDNVVSPITCVSMNHQNQLEQMTNDCHVRYSQPKDGLFGCRGHLLDRLNKSPIPSPKRKMREK
jgi:hypothetical protein